ncbi:hypothetical protein [Virgibacillus sp. L01]|uniref:hypothetical protein n=1 Tax=Virgibacillus sp. L01 TaxID=3457429 RepID=UPI003FD39E4A
METPAGKQQLKIPQEAVFASEEAEALPAESEMYFRSEVIALQLFFRSTLQFISIAKIKKSVKK